MSRTFNFRLQKVLKYREEREKEAQGKLTEARNSLQNSLSELSSLKNQLLDVYSQQRGETGVELNIDDCLCSSRYVEYINSCISKTEEEIREKEEEVREERRQLETKMVERKVLSNLRERQHLVHRKAGDTEEQKMNDEFAVTGFSRK